MSLLEPTYLSIWKGAVALPHCAPGGLSLDTFQRVVNEVCAGTAYSSSDLLNGNRTRAAAHLRQEVMHRLRSTTYVDGAPRYSLTSIARRFGKDHTTIIHGIRAHERRIAG